MAGPNETRTRLPAVAGLFYPADSARCRARATELTIASAAEGPTHRWIGGVVPHAGWDYSGAIAGLTLATIGRCASDVELVVVFGAIHTPLPVSVALLDSFTDWSVPADSCTVDTAVRGSLASDAALFRTDDRFHTREHAVEVELPLIRSVWPNAAILPVEVPPGECAVNVGRATANAVRQASRNAVYLASSDLTHYGPAYGFAPAGVGAAALGWAKQNDLRLIEHVLSMRAEAVVPEARERLNACGAGAVAAMMAACMEQGAREAVLLRHTNSYESAAAGVARSADNTVGYAAIVVG